MHLYIHTSESDRTRKTGNSSKINIHNTELKPIWWRLLTLLWFYQLLHHAAWSNSMFVALQTKIVCFPIVINGLIAKSILHQNIGLNFSRKLGNFIVNFTTYTMAIRVVEFSNGGYKITKIFAWESSYPVSFT